MNENVLKKSRVLEYLVKEGVLTASQAREAVLAQDTAGGNVLDLLVQAGTIGDVQLARALGKAFQCPLVNLTRTRVTKSALRRASGEFCRRHQVLPFSLDPNTGELLVAISDPEQRTAIEALRFRNNQNIKTFIAPRQQLREAIEYYYFSGAVPELTASHKPAPATKPHIPLDPPPPDTGKHAAHQLADRSPIPIPIEPKIRSEAEAFFLGPATDDPDFLDLQERTGTGDAEADLFSNSQVTGQSQQGFPRAASDIVTNNPLLASGPSTGPFSTDDNPLTAPEDLYTPFAPPSTGEEIQQRLEDLEQSLQRLERTLRYQMGLTQFLAQLLVQRGLISAEQLATLLKSLRE